MSCIRPTATFYGEREGVRLYRVGGALLPSASSIADGVLPKDELRHWAVVEAVEHMAASLQRYIGQRLTPEALALAKEEALRRPDRLARQAAAIAQDVHAALARMVNEGGDVPPGLRPVADWLRRWQGMGFTWHSEVPLGSVAVGAAGRVDLLGVHRNGVAVIADLKTAAAARDSHFLQLGIYSRIALHHGLEVHQAFVLLLPRTGEPLRVVEVDLDTWYRAAEHAIGLFSWLRCELWETEG